MLLQNTIKIYYAVIKNTFYLFICTSQLMDHFLADLKCTLAVSLNNDIRCCFILCSSCFHQIRNILYILVTIQKRTFVTVLHAVKNGLRVCFQKNNLAISATLRSRIATPPPQEIMTFCLDCMSINNWVSRLRKYSSP